MNINDISDHNYLYNLPGLFCIKTVNSRYMSMSKSLIQRLGWSKLDQVIGKSDFDIPSPAREIAPHCVRIDQKIIESKQTVETLDVVIRDGGYKILISQKSPIFNSLGEIAGIFYHGIDITETNLFPYFKTFCDSEQKILKMIKKPASYLLAYNQSPIDLSTQQQLCVFFLIRGKRTKEIAHILGISTRTVESYIEIIKHKLGCCSQSQIIEKAIDAGFLYYIPKDILNVNPDKL
jgi:DNA-binding CsgD family transcriptional regulator